MHWYIADETNTNFTAEHFFIYGGLVMTDQQCLDVTDEVARIRAKYGYRRGDSFKFHTRARPDHVSIADSKASKKELVEALETLGVRMIVYVILHDIAQRKPADVRMNWALNTVTWAYYRLLESDQARGVFLMDRADEQHAHLTNLFQEGIDVSGNRTPVDDRVIAFGMTSDNASHLSSAVDVALGGFRYCVNAAGGNGSEAVASDMFPPLARIIWAKELSGIKYLRNWGFHAMPKTEIKSARYRAIYDELYRKLTEFTGTDASLEADE